YGTRRITVAGLLVTLAGLGVQIAFDPLARTPEQLWAAALFILLVAATWLFGFAVQARRDASALQAQTDQAEDAQRAAIAAERIHIARELHDLIAHNVSVVVVQSVAAQGILNDQPAPARASRWPTLNKAAGRPSESYAGCSASCVTKANHMSCANHNPASPSSPPSLRASARQVSRLPCRSTANRRRIQRRWARRCTGSCRSRSPTC
ncbi:MAG: hypothetical protein JO287_06600, partial [Pseudonocardiales bacterium]|nr:hypothetical protein [Pseudonocardiales bacterium]